MNKETRSFIWGLMLILICGGGVAIHIIQLKSGLDYTLFDWVLLVLCCYGMVLGAIRVFKAI